jgi:O-antigen ligase
MRLGTLSSSFHFFNDSKRNLIAVIVIGFLAYECAELVINSDLSSFLYEVVIVFGIMAVVAIFNDWRRGAYCFITWILVEDFIRKYLGNDMVIYFAKDVLVLLLYFAFFRAHKANLSKIYTPPFRIVLLVFFWYGLLQVFNPASTSIFFGLMGLKLYFFYVPLLFIGYALVDSEKQLRRFFLFNSVLIFVVAGLGLAQSILGHTFLNPEVMQEDIREMSTLYRPTLTGLVAYRPTSVFVSAGRFQNFLIVSWILALGFAGFLMKRKQTARLLSLLTVGVVAAAALMAASRGVFLWTLLSALVIAVAFVWGASWDKEQQLRAMRAIRRSAIFSIMALVILVSIFPEEFASRVAIYSETLLPSSPTSELGYRSSEYPFQNFVAAFDYPRWPYGYGIGTASLGAQYVYRIFHAQPMRVGVENGYGQLIVEFGLPGLLLWILLASAITLSAWRVVKKLRGTDSFPIAFAIFWYVFLIVFPLSFYGITAYQDFIMNAYFWLMLGILFRLPEFPRNLKNVKINAATR